MTVCATRDIPDDYHPTFKKAVAQDSGFAIVSADILDFDVRPLKDVLGILIVKSSFLKGLKPLLRIVGDRHTVSVYTITFQCKRGFAGSGCAQRYAACTPCAFSGPPREAVLAYDAERLR